eukprot:TRINITY_DN18533_c0_g1_i4.p1 TRINITY_DN18533_c0_g1~~TRINITY_DN18533_c0_g1_i4.p1  ORF type:complete len:100 (-),score=8.50 TRINITY_DN18533_c0_g1_i4:94-393(-)
MIIVVRSLMEFQFQKCMCLLLVLNRNLLGGRISMMAMMSRYDANALSVFSLRVSLRLQYSVVGVVGRDDLRTISVIGHHQLAQIARGWSGWRHNMVVMI